MQIHIRLSPNLTKLASQFEGNITDGFNWGELVPVVADAAERIFRTEGHGGWTPLNERYAAWKARFYPGAGILVRTGAYFEAATTPGGAHNVIEVGRDSLTYGVEGLDYPVYHENAKEGSRLPRRPVFALLAEDQELTTHVAETMAQFITEKLTHA